MNKVQKLLLGLAATAVISPAFAENDYQFYLTLGGGAVMQNKYSSYTEEGVETKFKKPKVAAELLLGVGYYVVENVRVEAVFVKPFINDSKATVTTGAQELNINEKVKGEINSLQVRGYFDVVDISDFGKAYVGAGLGWAQVKPKNTMDTNQYFSASEGKKTNNLAWLVGAGAAFDVADGVKLGVEYNYQDFGQGKFKDADYKPKFNGHAVLARLNFNI